MKFQIISSDNGVGLTRDRWIVQSLLEKAGHQVRFSIWNQKPVADKYDANIFLELVNPALFYMARHNFIVPNPEWFQSAWGSKNILNNVTVLCKTRDTERIFSSRGYRTKYTSFTSEDRYDKNVLKKPTFIHLPGKSDAKGTLEVIQAFSLKDMPQLNIYCHPGKAWRAKSDNVLIHRERLDDEQFKKVQNENLYHLCPSAYEGFGHYINEGKSAGAVVITTAAQPMTELIDSNIGIGITADRFSVSHLATLKHPSVKAIASAVKVCQQLGMMGTPIGVRARDSYLQNDVYFRENFLKIVTNC